jgi:hypothetical protein
MSRPRFPAWLTAGLLMLLAMAWGDSSWGQQKSLFPSQGGSGNGSSSNSAGINKKAPAHSEALRNPKRQEVPPPRPDTVSLPFNLVWGDSRQRLASLFAGVGAQVTNKKATGELETWTVQGLIAPNLQTSLFTFVQDNLIALEFDYGQASWDLPKYNDTMGQFRKLLDKVCEKPGEIISRQTDQPSEDPALKQSLMGYQWRRGDTLVQLFYFSAEDTAKALTYRTISVHYHYQDPADLDAANGGTGESSPAPGANSPANPSLFPNAASKPLTPDADPLPER